MLKTLSRDLDSKMQHMLEHQWPPIQNLGMIHQVNLLISLYIEA